MRELFTPEAEPESGDFSARYTSSQPLPRHISTRDLGWANILPFVLDNLRSARRFLDIGSGQGTVTTLVASKGIEAVGLEGSASGVDLSRRQAETLGVEGTTFIEADLSLDRPLPVEGTFDFAFASELLEHIEDDVGLVSRVGDKLAPGGMFVATSPSAKAVLHRWRVRRRGQDELDTARGHVRRYTSDSFKRLAVDAGLEPVAVEPIAGFVRDVLFSSEKGMIAGRFLRRPATPLIQGLDRLTLRFGESQLMLVARRPLS